MGVAAGLAVAVLDGGDVGDGEERVRATFTLVYAAIAEAPFAVVAAVAFEETVVGEGRAV